MNKKNNEPFYVRKRKDTTNNDEVLDENSVNSGLLEQEKSFPKEENDGIKLKKSKKKQEIAKKTQEEALILAKKDIKKSEKNPIKANVLSEIGIKSEEVVQKNREIKTNNDELYNKLIENHEILLGIISGIEDGDREDSFNIVVTWNGLRVLIPDYQYFEDGFNFGVNYNELTSAIAKTRKRKNVAIHHNGAQIYFILKKVATDNYGVEFAVASRKEAMAMIRDEWFLHSNPDKIYEREAKIGDIAPAHVISVVENSCLVECLGVETRLDANTLTNQYVENCKDFVSPGDTIEVRIRKLYLNNGVYMTVNGRLNDNEGVIRTMKVKSNYLGCVDHYNKDKDMYVIRLNNGVNANVYSKSVIGTDALFNGQMVQVYVYSIMQNYVIGSAYLV